MCIDSQSRTGHRWLHYARVTSCRTARRPGGQWGGGSRGGSRHELPTAARLGAGAALPPASLPRLPACPRGTSCLNDFQFESMCAHRHASVCISNAAPAFTLRMRDFVPNRTLPRRLIGGDEKGWHPAKVSREASAVGGCSRLLRAVSASNRQKARRSNWTAANADH